MDYAKQLAKRSLEIGAITLSPDDPYTWASGFRMPIYNDNRKHLRFPENRKLITDAFKHEIEEAGLEVDILSGTSTAGIAPAASLAQALDVPINIFDGAQKELVCQYTPEYIGRLVDKVPKTNCDVIVSTCPAAIIPAVFVANERGLPFAYVREKQKGHGLKQQIEGILNPSERIIIVDFHNKYSYLKRAPDLTAEMQKVVGLGAKDVLEGMGLEIVGVVSEDILPDYQTPQLKNKKIKHIEDLVSTGGSCIKEIERYREEQEATIEHCNAIFSYEFPETIQKFDNIGCGINAIFGYSKLLSTAEEMNSITIEQHLMLKDWREDSWNWGANHGFPKEEK